jgi:CBS domain-containing protein/mannitol/fructose-specific phosphotransferase system IIA component (Ntr-type)
MDLLDLLPQQHIIVPLEATTLRAAVERLLDCLVDSGAVPESDGLRRRVRSEPLREVVGVSEDVILAHYRSEEIPAMALALGVAREPIPADDSAMDARPRVVALILAPQDPTPLYLQATSSLARALRKPGIVKTLASQPDAAAILALPDLQGLEIRPRLAVRDVMSHRVRVVPPDTPVRGVMELMLRRRVRAVPIVGTKGEVLGVVTESDLMRALLPQIPRVAADEDVDTTALDRPVREVMTRSVLCVSEDLSVSEVASMMINKDVEQLPVVQAGNITGMVSRGDIIRKLFYRP